MTALSVNVSRIEQNFELPGTQNTDDAMDAFYVSASERNANLAFDRKPQR